MIDDRIGELRLRVRAPSGREPEVGPAAERFARAVLERAAGLLEARAPGRLVLIRHLPIRWRLGEPALADPGAIGRFAADLAATVEAEAAAYSGPPSGDRELVVFDDEAHWRAAHLLARARGRGADAWFYAAIGSPDDPLALLCVPDRRALALAVLTRLAEEGLLVEVLACFPPESPAALARALGVFAGPDEGRRPGPDPRRSTPGPLLDFARSLPPSLPFATAALALHVQALRLPGASASPVDLRCAMTHALTVIRPVAPSSPRTAGEAGAPPDRLPGVPAPEPDGPSGMPHRERIFTGGGPAAEEWETRFGGLFYSLSLVLELDLGEILWKACLPEGAVLAHAAAALLGPAAAGDPAPLLFGGIAPDRPFPEVSSDQQEEVCAALLASLAGALPRRGLACLPETILGLAEHPAGRMLVASAPGIPFALFAWPAPTPPAAAAGVRALLSAWPRSATPIRTTPGLAELDQTARLRPWRRALVFPKLLTSPAESASAAALLVQVVGSICHLFAARAGGEAPSATAFVQQHLALSGRVGLVEGTMTVTLSMKSIDIHTRRAGLDRDPGWIPWLGRTVRIVFEDGDREAPLRSAAPRSVRRGDADE